LPIVRRRPRTITSRRASRLRFVVETADQEGFRFRAVQVWPDGGGVRKPIGITHVDVIACGPPPAGAKAGEVSGLSFIVVDELPTGDLVTHRSETT
jgi:hypothetical protein